VSTPHRLPFRRSHDPWWDLDGTTVRRRRKLKMALDISILVVAITMLAIVFGSRPVFVF
jgi:hypothetical protein